MYYYRIISCKLSSDHISEVQFALNLLLKRHEMGIERVHSFVKRFLICYILQISLHKAVLCLTPTVFYSKLWPVIPL